MACEISSYLRDVSMKLSMIIKKNPIKYCILPQIRLIPNNIVLNLIMYVTIVIVPHDCFVGTSEMLHMHSFVLSICFAFVFAVLHADVYDVFSCDFCAV